MNDYVETPNDLAFQAGYKAGMKARTFDDCTCTVDIAKTVRVICLCPKCGGKVDYSDTRERI